MLSPSRDNSETPADHWKNRIEQRTTRLPASGNLMGKPGSAAGVRRRRGARLRLLLLCVFFAGVAFVGWLAWRDLEVSVAADVALPSIDFKSDGMITKEWVVALLGKSGKFPPVHEIKSRLEAVPQVKHTEVRRLPDGMLMIRISERRPVMRMVARLSDGRMAPRLISTEGVIYEGINVGQLTFANLPVLDGLHPRSRLRSEPNYDVIEGFETVANFLDLAREKYPAIYRDWLKVSLRDYPGRPDAPGALLRVKPRLNVQSPDSAAIVELVFSPANYARELNGLALPAMTENIRQALRAADRTKFPAFRLDLSLTNWTDPRKPIPELHLQPVAPAPRQP